LPKGFKGEATVSEDLVFYTNPHSRGQIARWMLEEVGAPYDTVRLDYDSTMKSADYLAINPMGKVPAIVHKGHVVTETAAICAYLAEAFLEAGLKPGGDALADYYRWMFFAAGPVEAAFFQSRCGFCAARGQAAHVWVWPFRTGDRHAGKRRVAGKSYVAGDRFSAADVYVGSMINFLTMFGMLAPRPAFTDYLAGLTSRPAYIRAKEIDAALQEAAAPLSSLSVPAPVTSLHDRGDAPPAAMGAKPSSFLLTSDQRTGIASGMKPAVGSHQRLRLSQPGQTIRHDGRRERLFEQLFRLRVTLHTPRATQPAQIPRGAVIRRHFIDKRQVGILVRPGEHDAHPPILIAQGRQQHVGARTRGKADGEH
jgi:glutathione S-transferase